jgi:hypothetical protein
MIFRVKRLANVIRVCVSVLVLIKPLKRSPHECKTALTQFSLYNAKEFFVLDCPVLVAVKGCEQGTNVVVSEL